MSEETQTDSAHTFGTTLDSLKAFLVALVGLRDEGKVIFFLSRRSNFRLIGDPKCIQDALANGVDVENAAAKAAEVEREIRELVSHYLRTGSVEDAVRMLDISDFERRAPAKKGKHKLDKDIFDKVMRAKFEMIENLIVSGAIKERQDRLKTSTVACLEEIDYEVISEREDHQKKSKVTGPFLRIRLRYTDIKQEQFLGPFLFSVPSTASSFEIECDLSDIDLFVKRLGDAKQRLLGLQSAGCEGEK